MRDKSVSIKQNVVHPKSMDFDSLRKKAIEITQNISGENWKS